MIKLKLAAWLVAAMVPGALAKDVQDQLLEAVHRDDFQSVHRLLDVGANVRSTNRYGVHPLHFACLNGNEQLVQLFLSKGADPNQPIPGGETPLMTAARTGLTGPMKALLAGGAVVSATERRGQNALMWAAAEGNHEVMELLLAAGADFKTTLDSGHTALTLAVREGRAEAVRTLLKAGADVNEPMRPRKSVGRGVRNGTSPLLLAVENGHFELALELVDAGAELNDQRSGFTPLHNLTWVRKPNRGDDEAGDPAPTGSGKISSLHFARELVRKGADVNARLVKGKSGTGHLNRVGATPFLLAAFTGDLAYMRLLIELGADPLTPNTDGATPLMAASGLGVLAPPEEAGSEEEALEAVELLLSKGADINAVDKNGETAMHGAAYKMFPRVVELLASKGAKVEIWNQKNKWGWTPLLIAQGYRPGNYRPSPETEKSIVAAMRAQGVEPPPRPTQAAAGPDYSK